MRRLQGKYPAHSRITTQENTPHSSTAMHTASDGVRYFPGVHRTGTESRALFPDIHHTGTESRALFPLYPSHRHLKSCVIFLIYIALVSKVERGGSPDAIWWYLNASGLPLRTRFCTSPDAFKIIPDAFRYHPPCEKKYYANYQAVANRGIELPFLQKQTPCLHSPTWRGGNSRRCRQRRKLGFP